MKTPLVVIVGRPNVGKSTLFNRLTKSQDAIVDDISGVTRDRIYGEADWNGKVFRVIDTGGYVPNSEELFETAIREQVEIGLAEADAILFVTDGKQGISPLDSDIANMLRSSSKPSFVLVNKLDNPKHGINKAEFYSFGMENVYDISALSGRNLGDFLDDLIQHLDFSDTDKEEDTRLRLAIIGKPNVGKSSLTNALLGYDRSIVTDIPGTTRDSIDSILKYYGNEIVLVDTAGLRRKSKVQESIEFYSNVRTYRALWESDVSVIMLDSELGLEKQDQRIIQEAVRRRKGIILAVNKWDLIEKDAKTAKHYEEEVRSQLGTADFVPVIFISALTKQRIYKLIDIALQIYEERSKKISTQELNDTILEAIRRTPPPSTPNGKEVKIKYITQVGEHYPIFLFFANDCKYIPDSYKRFLEKTIRSNYGFSGVPMTISFKES
ncbi:gtp-binding protein enga [hydrocarbon metagenome]|uniref:GTPase Der n=1 Tax=hydrocarbon metagenome TaxID=938273 RepID=A0A0W8FVM9_9ZZZZ